MGMDSLKEAGAPLSGVRLTAFLIEDREGGGGG